MHVLLAFSGGLDTSYLLRRFVKEGHRVTAITVDTGGLTPDERIAIATRAQKLGAADFRMIDARQRVYDQHIAWLIKANVRRGGVYPLCVGAERVVQAQVVAESAGAIGADAVCHGSTGAGNDQIRFDVAIRTLLPGARILTPIRDERITRATSAAFLTEEGFPISAEKRDYSINAGLWGVTIGGRETHDPWQVPPEAAYPTTKTPALAPAAGHDLLLRFENGLVEGGLDTVEALNAIGAAHGVGRGMHLGDTILGIKGRIAFEAPAAAILLDAHRELEKLVLTRWQLVQKEQLGSFYGQMLHEGQWFDPVMRDIEAFLDSSQRVVTGDVKVHLEQGRVEVRGVRSPYSLVDEAAGRYGEENGLWTAQDARGFSAVYGLQGVLAARARARAASSDQNQS
ncbi:MAG: argininosuccinate synthase [Pseudomonadota bacterium]|nr:argininosuccinate synthase [Pseudomonadota bacterium]